MLISHFIYLEVWVIEKFSKEFLLTLIQVKLKGNKKAKSTKYSKIVILGGGGGDLFLSTVFWLLSFLSDHL
jgi:hypothetical protein